MATADAYAIGVLDGMMERGEVAIERYQARLGAMEGAAYSAQRLRGTIQVMQGRLESLRLSRSRQQTATPAH